MHQPAPSSTDEAAIAALIQRFREAWNHHNAQAFAALFTENGEWTNVFNETALGKANVEAMHVYPFSGPLKDAVLTIHTPRLTWLRPDIVSVDFNWESTGNRTPQGQPVPDRNGLITMIVTKEEGTWRITIGHNVDYTAAYKRPDFVKEANLPSFQSGATPG